MKKFFKEFRDFALKGNVIDLAVGVIIGAAFQAIVTSLVKDVISPLIGILLKGNLDGKSVNICGATLTYGSFLTAVINFLITAFVIFVFFKFINRITLPFRKKDEAKEITTKKYPYCCSEISVKATRCPHCTSVLEEQAENV